MSGADYEFELAAHHPLPCNHYTYFIVPFGYRIQTIQKDDDAMLEYAHDPDYATHLAHIYPGDAARTCKRPRELQDRKDYLLPETQLTLFTRARWFQLQSIGDQKRATLHGKLATRDNKGHSADVAFTGTAELILFEFPAAVVKADVDTNVGTVGLLLFSVVLDDSPVQRHHPTFADLLLVNEHLRYLTRPYFADRATTTLSLHYDALPDSPIFTSSMHWHVWQTLIQTFDVRDGSTHYKLCLAPPQPATRDPTSKPDPIHRLPGGYPDTRAFVYTCAYVDPPEKLDISALQTQWLAQWFRLLDVDSRNGLYPPPSTFELDWLDRHTYKRWQHDGTLYGFTDFCAAMLVVVRPGANVFAPGHTHFQTMYLDQLLLLLYERVTLHRFSSEISQSTHDLIGRDGAERHALPRYHALRKEFTLFTNLYQFPMFTTQYQGQEMYQLARSSLNIDGLYYEAGTEIRTTDEWLTQQNAETLNTRLRWIQYGGTVIGLVALVMTGVQAIAAAISISAYNSKTTVGLLFGWLHVNAPTLGVHMLDAAVITILIGLFVAIGIAVAYVRGTRHHR